MPFLKSSELAQNWVFDP